MINNKDVDDINKAFTLAHSYAKKMGHAIMTSDHILLGLLKLDRVKKAIQNDGIDTDRLLIELDAYLVNRSNIPSSRIGEVVATEHVEKFLRNFQQAINAGENYGPFHVLRDIEAENSSMASYFLVKYQIKPSNYIAAEQAATTDAEGSLAVLETYCINLNRLAAEGKIDPLVGRKTELHSITKVLAKRKKRNIVLVGEPGVGKTHLVEGLALRIVKEEVPDHIKNHVIWSLDIGDLLAGTKYRGEFEERIKNIFAALTATKNNILFISEAHQMRGAGSLGSGGGVDFANMIKPALARGDLKMIADTTWAEYVQHFEKDGALMRRFVMVRVGEPSIDESKQILAGLREHFESFHGGKITDDALAAAVDYSVKYITDRHLPDKAIDLIDGACAQMKNNGMADWTVDRQEIADEIYAVSGRRVDDVKDENGPAILDFAAKLKSRIFQQDAAMDAVAAKIVDWKAGMKKPKKPIGSFMFIGASGVGKTQTAKELSDLLGMKLLHYHMSQYSEKHTIATLIGAPPGYIGHGNGQAGDGILINDIQKNPNSIILFDEMAGKTHEDVVNVLLSMADEGEVVSMSGRKANCEECIIIVSGNLGEREESAKKPLGYIENKTGTTARQKAVDQFFLPEIQGRFTKIFFEKLTPVNMRKIVVRDIKSLETTRASLLIRGVKLLPSEALVDHLIGTNKDKKMGARPYQDLVEELIVNQLSIWLLTHPDVKATTIEVDWKDDKLTINEKVVEQILVPDARLA